jgi:opacity protein-like surface antigen
LGFAIHALGEYSLNDRYFIKLGLGMAFNQGGTMLHDDGYIPRSELSEDNAKDVLMGKNDVDVTYLIQYVEIPLAFRMRTRDFGYVRYFIDIPEIKFGIGVKKRGDVEASSLTLEKEVFNKDINTFNVWWGLGGGLEYDVSENTTLTAGLHFLQSFFDITDNKATDGNGEREDSKGNMSGIGLRVGVLF